MFDKSLHIWIKSQQEEGLIVIESRGLPLYFMLRQKVESWLKLETTKIKIRIADHIHTQQNLYEFFF